LLPAWCSYCTMDSGINPWPYCPRIICCSEDTHLERVHPTPYQRHLFMTASLRKGRHTVQLWMNGQQPTAPPASLLRLQQACCCLVSFTLTNASLTLRGQKPWSSPGYTWVLCWPLVKYVLHLHLPSLLFSDLRWRSMLCML
jgi:hypothetical protein